MAVVKAWERHGVKGAGRGETGLCQDIIVSFDEGMGICSGKSARGQGYLPISEASRVGKGGVLVSGSAAGAGAVGPPVPWRGGDWGGDGPGPRPPNRLVPGGRIFARPVAGERHGGRRNRAAVARTGDEGFSRLPGSEQTDRGGLACCVCKGKGTARGLAVSYVSSSLPAYLPGSVYISFNNNNK